MFRTAFRSLGIVVVLLVLIATAPGAWADPAEDGRGRSQRADERRQDGSHEKPDDAEEGSEEEGPEDGSEEEDSDEGSEEEGSEREERPPGQERKSGSTPPGSDEERGGQADLLKATFAVSATPIAPGETSTVTMTARNAAGETIDSLEMLVELPPALEFVSAIPAARHDAGTLALDLGPLAPEETVEASVVVRALPSSAAPDSPLRFALVADDQVFSHEVVVEVDGHSSETLQLAQSGPLLVQVGDVGSFRLRISNTGEAPLRDVAVVTTIAPELDVVGVTPIEEADAIQLGSSPSAEDVVWIFHELDPAESVDLFWTARAAAPGDLEANNATVARVDGQEVAESVQRTYLGYVEALQVEREEDPAPVVQRRVLTKLVPVSREVAPGVAGLLPATGAAPGLLTGAAAICIALGLVCLWLSSRSRSVRHGGLVAIAALLLTTTACVSTPEPPSADPPRQDAAETPEGLQDDIEPDADTESEDEVLGVRIERDPPEAGPSGADETPSADLSSPEAAAPVTDEVVFEEVTVVETVLVPAASLPVREMRESNGDNVMSITWARRSESLTAVSSRTVTVDATEELLTSVVASGPRLTATVTLRNVAEDRLAATGRLRLQIEQGEAASTLYSERVEVVLDPGEEVSADFTFSLPEGSFALRGGFEPY